MMTNDKLLKYHFEYENHNKFPMLSFIFPKLGDLKQTQDPTDRLKFLFFQLQITKHQLFWSQASCLF